MKHGCELVIFGLAAMQGYSDFKSQLSRKMNWYEIHKNCSK